MKATLFAITLLAAYLACWSPTKERGVADVARYADAEFERWREDFLATIDTTISGVSMPYEPHIGFAMAPLIVRAESGRVIAYYFWFFGYVAKLPYEREIEPIPVTVSGPEDGNPFEDFGLGFKSGSFGISDN